MHLPGQISDTLHAVISRPIEELRHHPLSMEEAYEVYAYLRAQSAYGGVPGVVTLESGNPGNLLTLSGYLHSNEPCYSGAAAMALALYHQGQMTAGSIKLIVNNLEGANRYWASYRAHPEAPLSERSQYRMRDYNMNRIPYALGDVAKAYWAFCDAHPLLYRVDVITAAYHHDGQPVMDALLKAIPDLANGPVGLPYETRRLLQLMPYYYERVPEGGEQLVIDYHSMSAPGKPMLLWPDTVLKGEPLVFGNVKHCAPVLLSNFAQLTAQATGLALYAHLMMNNERTFSVALECGQHELLKRKHRKNAAVLVAAESAYDTAAALGLTPLERTPRDPGIVVYEATRLAFPPVLDESYYLTREFRNGERIPAGTVMATSTNGNKETHPDVVTQELSWVIFATNPAVPLPTKESAWTDILRIPAKVGQDDILYLQR